jgi:hypothetical protein
MTNIAKAMIISDFLCPFFNCAALYFNGLTAALADKVMMMALSAEAINSLTIIATQDIDNLVIDQTLQRSIDRSQPNTLTFTLHQAIDLLRASKTTSTFKCA